MPLGNAFIANMQAHYFQNADHADVGDATGLVQSTADGNFYMAAYEAYPTRAGTADNNEASYTGYARVACTRNGSTLFTQSGNEIVTASAITFPKQTDSGTDVLMFWALTLESSGASEIVQIGAFGGDLPKSFTGETDDAIYSDGHGLSNNDRVVLYALTDDLALPTGVTEGTVYHVINAATDDFEISTSQGGSAVNITAAGVGRWQKVEPIQMALNVAPSLDAGARLFVIS